MGSKKRQAPEEARQPEPDPRIAAASARLSSDRDFCKSLLTLCVAILGIYITLLTWAFPRNANASSVDALQTRTVLFLSLPVLDFALAIAAFALGYIGAGFIGEDGFAPTTLGDMQRFHVIQISWIRAGGISLVVGLLTAFVLIGRFLLNVDPTVSKYLDYFATATSMTIALLAARVVLGDDFRWAMKRLAYAVAACAILLFIADTWGVAAAGCVPGAAILLLAVAIAWMLAPVKS
jgi:hypothetical protein